MGNAYREHKDYDQAIECYKKVVELNPEDHEGWNNMLMPIAEKVKMLKLLNYGIKH